MTRGENLQTMGCFIRDLGGEFEVLSGQIVNSKVMDPYDLDSVYSAYLDELSMIGKNRSYIKLLCTYLSSYEKELDKEESFITDKFIRLGIVKE